MTEKIENALNESRILVLVAQVILGFQYQSFFQTGFDRLPRASKYLKLCGLGLMLVAVALLIAPAAYHRLVEQGNVSRQFHRFITHVTTPALLPFALGLSLDFYVVGDKLFSRPAGIVIAFSLGLTALVFWYGIEALAVRKDSKLNGGQGSMTSECTPLKDKIKFVLTEARVVLPGAQALLGFQFATVLTDSFDHLGRVAQCVHLVSLVAVALCTILLMAPAAYHRIVESGEDTERLHTFSTRMILGAMWLLALGISGDVFVVVHKVLHSTPGGVLSAGLTLLFFWGEWFGYMLYRRVQQFGATRPAQCAGPPMRRT